MRKVTASRELPLIKRLLRRVGVGLATFILPSFIVDQNGGFARAASLLDEGYGLVVLVNHFSTRDGPQALGLLGRHPTMRRRIFVGPVADHQWRQHRLPVRLLTALFAIRLFPVVTPSAGEADGRRRRQGDGLADYLRAASAGLKEGSIVLLAPQARRRPRLGVPPPGRPIAKLLTQIRADDVRRVAFLFIGLSIPHEDDYSRRNAGGMNFGKLYEARVGPTVTIEEALREARGVSAVDDWVFGRLRELVPAAYGKRSRPISSPDDSACVPGVLSVPEGDGGAK